MTPAEQIEQLIKNILDWDHAYYTDGSSPVSDAVYDAAKMQLRELESAHPELARPDSPSLVIGQPKATTATEYRKVAHHVPMLSLKTEVDTSIEPIREFIHRIGDSRTLANLAFVAEPKFDGLGLDLQYVDGVLTEAVTRGDGHEGEDVLRHVRFITSIPAQLPKAITCDIRGEVTLNRDDLVRLNAGRKQKGERLYANPRNAAAGLMRMKQADPVHSFLRFTAYEIAHGDLSALGGGQYGHTTRLNFLQIAGFQVRYNGVWHHEGDVEILAKSLHNFYMEALAERNNLPYDIDGMVYKVNDILLREELGFTGREPNWAIAHKFVPERANTRVKDIITGVGKTGRITPVAVLEPVFVGGVVVTNATLVHEERMRQLGVRVGDEITVQRAGDVIPEVIAVVRDDLISDQDQMLSNLATVQLFKHCPACASMLVKDGAFYYCRAGSNCPGQITAVLETAVSRPLLNIQGLGEQTIAKLHENGDLRDMADIFSLDAAKLIDAGMSELLVGDVLAHVEKARHVPLWRVIAAIGIPGCGPSTAKELVKKYSSIAEMREATEQELQTIDDIGPATARSIVLSFCNKELYDKLEAVPNSWSSTQVQSNGMTVCITGAIEGWDRDALKAKLESLGYKTVDSVSKKTSILIAGAGAGGKLVKARELGIRTLTTAEEVNNLLAS